MRQADLYRSISHATGESVATIKRLGFLIANPARTIRDPDAECLGPHVIDWDEFDVSLSTPHAEPSLDFAPS